MGLRLVRSRAGCCRSHPRQRLYEAILSLAGTNAKDGLLETKHNYTVTLPKEGVPLEVRAKGGFWSPAMYDEDRFMLPKPANGRTNIGTCPLMRTSSNSRPTARSHSQYRRTNRLMLRQEQTGCRQLVQASGRRRKQVRFWRAICPHVADIVAKVFLG